MDDKKKNESVPAPVIDAKTGWARPIAQQKDSQIKAWLIFFGIILIGFSLWLPLRSLWSRLFYTKPETNNERVSNCFVALAYQGVSEEALQQDSLDISPEMIRAQIEELVHRGYNSITLDDVRAFYQEGKLLPPKAILLTFEQTRKSSYFEVRSVLKDVKWHAVMGVWTEPMHRMDAQALLWPYLQDMFTLGTWDLAVQSNRGFEAVPSGPNGASGHFFTTPMWLGKQQRFEDPREFVKRITADHKDVISEYTKELGKAPIAFFYPYGDYGQYDEMAKVVRDTNLNLVSTNYALGFALGNLALNTRDTDVRRLNRLLVHKDWSAKTLADTLDRFWPFVDDGRQSVRNFQADDWIHEWGDVRRIDNELSIRAIPPENPLDLVGSVAHGATTGAKAWLAGSDEMKDGFVAMRFQIKRGRFIVYLRSTSRGEYVSCMMDPNGKVSMRQKMSNDKEFVLAVDDMPADGRTDYELLLGLRGNMAYARLNGRMLFGGRVLLRGDSKPGMIGIGIWDEVVGISEAQIASTKLIAPARAVVMWTPEIARNPSHLSAWLQENSYRFTFLAPPWIDVMSSASFSLPQWDVAMIGMLAQVNKLRVCPRLSVQDAIYLSHLSVEKVAEDLANSHADGVFVDARDCEASQMPQLTDWLIKLKPLLIKHKFQLILRLPIASEAMPSTGNMIDQIPGVILAGEFSHPVFGLPWEQLAGTLSVDPEAGSNPLELYYQISEDRKADDVAPDVRADLLREKGFEAFTLGEYQKALEAWTQWGKIQPNAPEPFALQGDAYFRMNKLGDAYDAYSKSLEINPGQIDLAIRRSRLLEKMGKGNEQAAILNLYSRTFPGTSALVIEQAKWLLANKRRSEASALMKRLVKERPEEVEARQILQGMLDDPQERYNNLKDLTSLVSVDSSSIYGFGRILLSSDLLASPEAAVFFPMIREASLHAPTKLARQQFLSFIPLEGVVDEEFNGGKLSENWVSFGTRLKTTTGGRFEIRAGSEMAEAYLRLKRSDFMRDGFIEVNLDESVGFFWLYARRSTGAMVRFGFDDEGFLRIQCWQAGELRGSDNRLWLRPPGMLRIRLEVRGDGAIGYINGRTAFSTPLLIPNDLRYGWWSIAPFSPELGLARAKIGRIVSGPIPTTTLLVPPMDEQEIPLFLDSVRDSARELSAVLPVVYRQRQNGSIEEIKDFPTQLLRMFTSFHRLRWIPVIDASYYSDVEIVTLIEMIKKYNLQTLALCTRFMPTYEWTKKVTAALEKTQGGLIVIVSPEAFWASRGTGRASDINRESENRANEKGEPPVLQIFQIERGSVLYPPLSTVWTNIPATRFDITNGIPHALTWCDAFANNHRATFTLVETNALNWPRMYVYPSKGPNPNKDRPAVELNPAPEKIFPGKTGNGKAAVLPVAVPVPAAVAPTVGVAPAAPSVAPAASAPVVPVPMVVIPAVSVQQPTVPMVAVPAASVQQPAVPVVAVPAASVQQGQPQATVTLPAAGQIPQVTVPAVNAPAGEATAPVFTVTGVTNALVPALTNAFGGAGTNPSIPTLSNVVESVATNLVEPILTNALSPGR